MTFRRNRNWDGGREPEVSRMWAERQVADIPIADLAREAGVTPATWWGVESGELIASPDMFNKMRAIVRRRYIERRKGA